MLKELCTLIRTIQSWDREAAIPAAVIGLMRKLVSFYDRISEDRWPRCIFEASGD